MVLKDCIEGVTNASLRRLARRAGLPGRMSRPAYEEARGALREFLQDLIRDTVAYTEHSARKNTVTAEDVLHALRKQGRTLYGF